MMQPSDSNESDIEGRADKHIHPEVNTEGGPYIAGNVNTNGGDVVAGNKNIFYNTFHLIPFWMSVIFLALIAIGSVAGMINIIDRFGKKDLYALPMQSNFNVLITSFGLKDSETGEITSHPDGRLMATYLEDILTKDRDHSMLTQEDIDFRAVDEVVTDDTQEAVARLANEHNADVVIFGYILNGRQFVPEIYIDPVLAGAEEVYTSTLSFKNYAEGETTSIFGGSLPVQFPFNDRADRRNFTRYRLAPRFEALTKFMFGLALVKGRIYSEALNMFGQSAKIEKAWLDSNNNEKGKELLYLWIGTSMNLKAQEGGSDVIACPVLELEGISDLDDFQDPQNVFSGDWLCAKAAYEIALKKNDKFARAYIGLGNLWLGQARKRIQEDKDNGCMMYHSAIEFYDKASSDTMSSITSAQVEIKANYNLGLVWSNIHRYDCENAFEKAKSYFEKVITEVSGSQVTASSLPHEYSPQHFEAMANYYIGLLLIHDGKYKLAINAFDKADTVLGKFQVTDDLWQNIRYNVYNQKGLAYYQLARQDCLDEYWNEALKSYEAVVLAEPGFTDSVIVGDSFYYLGKIYAQQQNYEKAVSQFENASRIISQLNLTEVKLGILNGLIKINLGDAYLHLLETKPSSDTTSEIFRSYEDGFDLLEPFLRTKQLSGEEKDVLAIAYCNAQKLYTKLKQEQQAESIAKRVGVFSDQLYGYERTCINPTKFCL